MVPQPETVVQQRRRALADQNAGSSYLFVPEPARRFGKAPLITYGRSSNPLPLTGTQFVRRDTYDLPSDDDDAHHQANNLLQATPDEADPKSSESSDESSRSSLQQHEPDTVIRAPSRLDILQATSASACPAIIVSAKAVRKPRPRPTNPGSPNARRSRISKAKATGKAAVSAAKGPSKRPNAKTPARRLPVGEMFFVASSPDHGVAGDPLSSAPGIDIQDPIRDRSSQLRKPGAPGSSPLDKAREPLTAIRKRLQRPKCKHKSIASLRRKQTRPSLFASGNALSHISGDGFDASELEIKYRIRVPRHRRKHNAPTALTYSALQLCGGPLPEVAFDCSTDELQTELSGRPHHISSQRHQEEKKYALPKSPKERSQRRVSFSGRDDFILAQLSSVSAPPRHQSDSEDDEESQIDEDESQVDDAEAMADGFDAIEYRCEDAEPEASEDELTARASPPHPSRNPGAQANKRFPKHFVHVENIEEVEQLQGHRGSRQAASPGRLSKRATPTRRLIEVSEAIEEVPDVSVQVPRSEVAAHADERTPDTARRPMRRTRPILKNSSTQVVPESTVREEDTDANTRRNSMVTADDSRYFAAAAGMLDAPDPKTHRIVPRRRSSYFDEPHVQVADSERAIPEISPEPPAYANESRLAVLRKTSDTVWTSQSLPDAPRDLKALTRDVSREHGTLSQSTRRRSSLPLQSPTKVRT